MMLYLVRGVPGSGKSTLAKKLAPTVFEADQYFEDKQWEARLLGQAHKECFNNTRAALERGMIVAVANTFTREKELKPYLDLAEELGVPVTSIIVENRHGNKSVHNVPEETVSKMKARFEVNL